MKLESVYKFSQHIFSGNFFYLATVLKGRIYSCYSQEKSSLNLFDYLCSSITAHIRKKITNIFFTDNPQRRKFSDLNYADSTFPL